MGTFRQRERVGILFTKVDYGMEVRERVEYAGVVLLSQLINRKLLLNYRLS